MISSLLSLILPTYNRFKPLQRCLSALEKQEFDKSWEVIVIDDGSDVDIEPAVKEFSKKLDITFLKQPNKGPAAARNMGAKKAKGEYLVFIDDDCEPDTNWLMELSNHLQPGVMIGGRTENKLTNDLYAEASQKLVSYLYVHFYNTPWYFFTSNNFLVDRKTFLEIEGFDENFTTSAGEDREFCARWMQQGNQMLYRPNALVWHSHPMGLFSFWKLHFKYGSAAFDFRRKIKHLGVETLRPNALLYFHLLSFIWQMKSKNLTERFQLSCLIVLSQLATFFGFLSRN